MTDLDKLAQLLESLDESNWKLVCVLASNYDFDTKFKISDLMNTTINSMLPFDNNEERGQWYNTWDKLSDIQTHFNLNIL